MNTSERGIDRSPKSDASSSKTAWEAHRSWQFWRGATFGAAVILGIMIFTVLIYNTVKDDVVCTGICKSGEEVIVTCE
jgi:hypothetical protein